MRLSLDDILKAAKRGETVKILYHSPCPDGFAAAYCAWSRLGERAQYVPYDHERAPEPEACRGAWVAMCDCCFPRERLLSAVGMAKAMVVLDHHKSALDQNGDVPECEFDLERSGAGIAWGFFRPGERAPALVEHVQDRDLNRFELPATAAFCAHLDSLPMSFEAWDEAAKLEGEALARFLRQGSEMLRQFDSQAEAMARLALPCLFRGRRAWLLNAPYRFASRCAELLCAREGSEMAVIWSSRNLVEARLSLRSADPQSCDVSAMAVALGGGGHPGASGATVGLSALRELAELYDWPARVEGREPEAR